MTAETILTAVVRINLVASVAILLVLTLRPFVLRWLGARIVYWLWLVVPIAGAASFAPPRERVVVVPPPEVIMVTAESTDPTAVAPATTKGPVARVTVTPFVSLTALADVLVVVWLLGAMLLLVRSIVSTRRLAADPSVGPALVGVLRPKLVLPADFEARFNTQERSLILAHEQVHRVSGHTVVNALVELARCASWFNPLVHLAALRLRADQELACDAAVIGARPTARRAYAEALLKTQVAASFLPLGCTWTSPSGKRLSERIAMLDRPSLSRRGAITGAAAVAIVGVALGYAAWAQQPERLVTQRPEPVWTPSAEAPEGVLSHALEAKRHDAFIARARNGDIQFVFFGTTETEMWLWSDRGRAVWDRDLAPRKGADFGSQGTTPKSLLWRMRNGELDGYEAKLVVLQLPESLWDALLSGGEPNLHGAYAPIIAEIRARQPQAKILLLAPVPRGIHPRDSGRELWRQAAAANSAVIARLTDDKTVFYADFGEQFFLPDGSYNHDYWGIPGPAGAGIQPPAFEVWAKALQPWLDRFVR